jgi:hypothetical protein
VFWQSTILAAGQGDCESLDSGVLLQPVNAVSSLAFTVVGLAIVWWARKAHGHERILRIVFGTVMVATGFGSFGFHGFDHPLAQFSHDITFLALVWMLATINVAEVLGWSRKTGWMVVGFGVALLSAVLAVGPTVTNILTVVVTAALIGSDVVLERRGGIARPWWIASLVAMAIAVAAFILGRTGAPLCDPDSVFQGHALWHLFAAAAIGMYFVATSSARGKEEDDA